MARLNMIRYGIVAAALFSVVPAWAENVALVVANGEYRHGRNEPSIARDYNSVLRAYQQSGYEVYGGENLDRNNLARQMEAFEAALGNAEIAVVHLTGHTMAAGDHGWFLPVDINPDSATDFEFGALSLSAIAQLLAPLDGRAALFIGATERPFSVMPGIEAGNGAINAPLGLLVASGTATNVNRSVINEFLRRDTRVSDAIARTGTRLTYEGYISSRLVLAPRSSGAIVTVRPPQPQPPVVLRTPQTIENGLNLTRTQRRRVQENLNLLGFDTRGIDGVFGRGSRSAIASWQRDEGIEATGYLTSPQIARLERLGSAARREAAAADEAYWARTGATGSLAGLNSYLERYPNGAHAQEARRAVQELNSEADQAAWDLARDRDTVRAYERYLRDYPDGLYNRPAKVRIRELGGAADRDTSGRDDDAEAAAVAAERALGLDSGTRLLIELRLVALGYRPGATDGIFDAATRQAISAFQRDRNMPATGYVSAPVISALLRGG
ncbi:MAG: peptidoglycan-binding protein [Paracoccaceae bacterium]